MLNQIICGDALTILKTLPDQMVNCCVTSPPYWGLRDYNIKGQLGLEPTVEEYITKIVEVFQEVKRVLQNNGTLWLNLGDSYTAGKPRTEEVCTNGGMRWANAQSKIRAPDLKPKNLVGIPWRVAFALQAEDWYLRSDIIWAKPNPMPESVTDRPTKAHEYLFLLSKSQQYYYDADAIKEPSVYTGPNNGVGFGHGTDKEKRARDRVRGSRGVINNPPNSDIRKSGNKERKYGADRGSLNTHMGGSVPWEGNTRNKRTVWTVPTQPFPEAHFATFPPKLIEPCILAGCPAGGMVLDPFMGSGTTAMVAIQYSRNYLGIELNPKYIKIAEKRLSSVQKKLFIK